MLVVATPAGQIHELGALLVGAAAANLGWHVTYLGESLPAAEIPGAARQNRARAVALSLVYPEDDPWLEGELTRLHESLPTEVTLLVGGRATPAWERGVGPLVLEALRLARNFRSQEAVVKWVNDAFARVLPRDSDIASGAVSFEPAAAVRGLTLDDAVQVHAFVGGGAADEAKGVVEVVEAIRAENPQASIALLVRARSRLVEIAAELRQAGLCPTAVELHSLANQPLISDLVALTRALEHLADRTAWLSVLRAPWCGLTLADLAALAEGDSRPVIELRKGMAKHDVRVGKF